MSWRARWVNPEEGLTTRELPKGYGPEAGESVGRPKGRTVNLTNDCERRIGII
jgi:hypothetical protein